MVGIQFTPVIHHHTGFAVVDWQGVSRVTVPIADIVAATRLVTIDLRGNVLDFLAGQAVMVGTHGQQERRPYSIACSPERVAELGRLELLIALEPNGTLGANLVGAASGTLVDVEGPIGAFTFPAVANEKWLLFVAGGAGIAPLRAMLEHALRLRHSPRISVLYSARRGDEFAFIEELRGHAATGRVELHQTVTRDASSSWAGGRGRIGRSHFEAVLHEPAATLCFVCGPPPLVKESIRTLGQLGVPEAQIRTEQWGK
jgi:NAD(P)H-flavin reductase